MMYIYDVCNDYSLDLRKKPINEKVKWAKAKDYQNSYYGYDKNNQLVFFKTSLENMQGKIV